MRSAVSWPGAQYCLQVSGGGTISGGGCSNTRKANGGATVTLPSSGSSDVTVWAGYASGYSTVYVTNVFTLAGKGQDLYDDYHLGL
jgi:hypothetical protein